MLEPARGLNAAQLDAIAALAQRAVAVDGGRLKLEEAELRGRTGARVEDLLWWQGGVLLGFVGLYGFGSSTELAGMVDPAARRRGIGSALLDAAVLLCRRDGVGAALLVTSPAGEAFALRRGLVLDHREHALILDAEPSLGSADPALTVRRAGAADAASVARLHAGVFGWALPDPLRASATDAYATLLAERNGEAVGTLRLTRMGTTAGVYGIAVDPAWQGRGIGRDLLRRACVKLRADGVQRIGLEVFADNDRAVSLYTSLGFQVCATEQYWTLPI